MALLMTSFLILTNMSTRALDFESPTFTAMDIWFYACRSLVCFAILEFFLIMRKGSKPITNMVRIGVQQILVNNLTEQTSEEHHAAYDTHAFIFFNTAFLVFCVTYFSVCFHLR